MKKKEKAKWKAGKKELGREKKKNAQALQKKVNLKKSFPETIQRMDVLGNAKTSKVMQKREKEKEEKTMTWGSQKEMLTLHQGNQKDGGRKE